MHLLIELTLLLFHSLRFLSSKYVLIVTSVLALFFCQKQQLQKIPSMQKTRIDAYETIMQITDSIRSDCQLVWYETSLPMDNGVRDWRKEAVSSYVDYLLKTNNEINVISTPDFISKSIILYPDENNTNPIEASLFYEQLTNEKIDFLKNISRISIYINKEHN